MIRNNLSMLMAKHNAFSVEEISVATGLNKNTIVNIKYNRAKGIQYETLEALCKYFSVSISEMLEIVKDNAS
ncbi:helix-turn-helix domain-containing protein [Gorillibacterium sp. sgz5001074]|uniref:helix-turn-helix domain-containing protein n=1 Tax=Gorillibacterium sp. sgz5001074 TaxID=3446695 RepID=UPI003F679BEE